MKQPTAWHFVVVRRYERNIEDMEAAAFMDEFIRLLMAAGAPSDAAVYRVNSDGGHAYLLNPRAAQIASPILQSFSASAIEGEPEAKWLAELVQIRI